jgi:tRNA uridine 5-carboxymethylaminomethyl modification enzyme
VAAETARLGALRASPNNAIGREAVAMLGIELSRESSALDLLRRPELDYATLASVPAFGPAVADPAVAEQVEIETKYSGYLERQREEIARQRRSENAVIESAFDYAAVRGLSSELRQKLELVRPQTIGQAQRIPGMTPAAISLLLVHLERARRSSAA